MVAASPTMQRALTKFRVRFWRDFAQMILIGFVICFGRMLSDNVTGKWPPARRSLIVFTLLIVLMGLLCVGLKWLVFRARAELVRRDALRDAICPSCGYSLEESPREADGCRLCPECGGAWRVDDNPSPMEHA